MSEITYTVKNKSNRPEYREIAILENVFMEFMMLKHELKMTNTQLLKFLIRYYREHEKKGE
jgi:hypothetical protein